MAGYRSSGAAPHDRRRERLPERDEEGHWRDAGQGAAFAERKPDIRATCAAIELPSWQSRHRYDAHRRRVCDENLAPILPVFSYSTCSKSTAKVHLSLISRK